MPHSRSSRRLVVTAIAGIALALAGCSGDPSPEASIPAPGIGSVDLLAAGCPETIVIQKDWEPGAEHGHLYQMLGPDVTIDSTVKAVSGALYADGAPTGVNLEIRAGGSAVGFQSPASLLYTDSDVTLAYVSTDAAIAASDSNPVTAVFAPFEISPLMIMWDPATYPDATSVRDIAAEGAVIRYTDGIAYMDFLIDSGIVPADQVDGGFDGTPGSFIAAGGADGQQGVSTTQPYQYEHELAEWGSPVAYQLVHELGYAPYNSAVSVRSRDLDELDGCLTALVPVLQQTLVDFAADPDRALGLILDAVEANATGWTYSSGMADYSVETMLADGLVSNGANAYIGDMDEARVQDLIDIALPILHGGGVAVSDDLAPSDLFTNEYLDTSIGL